MSEIPAGAMRFNSDSQKLEYWNGSAWFQVHTATPNLAQSGDVNLVLVVFFWRKSDSSNMITADYINISSTGDAIDFANLTNRLDLVVADHQTRVFTFGGLDPSNVEQMSFNIWTIASTGDATDFGDLVDTVRSNGEYQIVTEELLLVVQHQKVMILIYKLSILHLMGHHRFWILLTDARQYILKHGIANPVRAVIGGGETPGRILHYNFKYRNLRKCTRFWRFI